VADLVGGDVDAAGRQPVSLLRGEPPIVADDVIKQICHVLIQALGCGFGEHLALSSL
jgi:hypothetical protein